MSVNEKRGKLIYGKAGDGPRDPDFPVVGTVRYELYGALDGGRCCIKRVEVLAICDSRAEARQWMLDREDEWPSVQPVKEKP